MSTPEFIPTSPDTLPPKAAPVPPPAPSVAVTLFLSQGYIFDARDEVTAIAVSDWRVAARRPLLFILLSPLIIGLGALPMYYVPIPRNANIPWFHMSCIITMCVLLLVMLFTIAPRRVVRMHTVAPGTRTPNATLLTLDEVTHQVRDRRESLVRGATGKHLGTLIAKPITARTTFTWLNSEGTAILTAREQSTLWTHAARDAESHWIAMVLRNLFHTAWHRKVTPHTTRHWNISPAPVTGTPPEHPPAFTPKQADPTPPPRWAQIQAITGSAIPIIIFPDCPSEHRLIPLLIAEYLEHYTLYW